MKKNNKIIIIILIMIISILIFFCVYPKISIYLCNKKLSDLQYDKKLQITYLIADENKTNGEEISVYNFDSSSESFAQINSRGMAFLNKKEKYYVGKLVDINPYIFNNIKDYVFTYNNLDGQILENCKFDKKTGEIKIPIEYYENSIKKENVQMEIISELDMSKLKKLKIDVSTFGLKNSSKKVKVNGNEINTLISIMNYNEGNKIPKSDLKVYVNNDLNYLDSSLFDWNSKAGTINIFISPLLINDIKVEINSNCFKKIFGNIVYADSYDTMDAAGKLAAEPVLSAGDTITLNSVPVAYKTGSVIYGDTTVKSVYSAVNGDDDLYDSCNTDNKSCTKYTGSEDYFAMDLSRGTVSVGEGKSISFPSPLYIKAYCSKHTVAADSQAGTNINIKLKVIAINTSQNYIKNRYTCRG